MARCTSPLEPRLAGVLGRRDEQGPGDGAERRGEEDAAHGAAALAGERQVGGGVAGQEVRGLPVAEEEQAGHEQGERARLGPERSQEAAAGRQQVAELQAGRRPLRLMSRDRVWDMKAVPVVMVAVASPTQTVSSPSRSWMTNPPTVMAEARAAAPTTCPPVRTRRTRRWIRACSSAVIGAGTGSGAGPDGDAGATAGHGHGYENGEGRRLAQVFRFAKSPHGFVGYGSCPGSRSLTDWKPSWPGQSRPRPRRPRRRARAGRGRRCPTALVTRPANHRSTSSSTGHPNGPGCHAGPGELVDLVARPAPEALGEVPLAGRRHVDGEALGRPGDVVGVVRLRDPHHEPGRVDAALGGEADQAPGPRLAGGGGDDEHRVVEVVRRSRGSASTTSPSGVAHRRRLAR